MGEVRGATGAEVVELLADVSLGVPKTVDGVDVRLREREDGRPVIVLAFRLDHENLERWARASFTNGEIPRAWVTYSVAKDALGISDVPDTWRLDISKPPGLPVERCVLVDDDDPANVLVGITRNPPDLRWPEASA